MGVTVLVFDVFVSVNMPAQNRLWTPFSVRMLVVSVAVVVPVNMTHCAMRMGMTVTV